MSELKDDIKRYQCKKGFIDRLHYHEGNMPRDLRTFGVKNDFYGTAYKLNGEGYWYDSVSFKSNFMEYLHLRDMFDAELIWDKGML